MEMTVQGGGEAGMSVQAVTYHTVRPAKRARRCQARIGSVIGADQPVRKAQSPLSRAHGLGVWYGTGGTGGTGRARTPQVVALSLSRSLALLAVALPVEHPRNSVQTTCRPRCAFLSLLRSHLSPPPCSAPVIPPVSIPCRGQLHAKGSASGRLGASSAEPRPPLPCPRPRPRPLVALLAFLRGFSAVSLMSLPRPRPPSSSASSYKSPPRPPPLGSSCSPLLPLRSLVACCVRMFWRMRPVPAMC